MEATDGSDGPGEAGDSTGGRSDAVRRDDPAGENAADPDRAVSACRTSAERTVFTEEGNTDGWIATDLTVDPRP